MAMVKSARLSWRLPPRLSRWRWGIEAITNRGRSGGERGVAGGLVLEGERGVPPAEGGREVAVERPSPDLEQEVGARGRPLHRLPLGEALAEQRVDQRLDEGGGDRLAGSTPSGVIRDQVSVPPEIALEAVHRSSERRELGIAGCEVPHAPLDLPEPLEGALDLAVPQVPLGVLERLLQLGGALGIHTRQTLQGLAQAGQLHREMEPIEQVR